MVTVFTRNWWVLALRGLVAVLFGIAALAWPQATLEALVTVFGVLVLVNGAVTLVRSSAATQWLAALVAGTVEIVIGVAILVWPNITSLVLVALIAGWAIITGLLDILAAIQSRREIESGWLIALGGALSIAFGVLMVRFPDAGAVSLAWLVGAYALLEGLVLIALAFRVRSVHKDAAMVEQRFFGNAA